MIVTEIACALVSKSPDSMLEQLTDIASRVLPFTVGCAFAKATASHDAVRRLCMKAWRVWQEVLEGQDGLKTRSEHIRIDMEREKQFADSALIVHVVDMAKLSGLSS